MIFGDKTIQPIDNQKSISDSLDQLEIEVNKLGRGLKVKADDILIGLDAIKARLEERESQGRTAASEQAQFDFVVNTLKKNTRTFLREIGGVNSIRSLRSEKHPVPKAWWWFLDEIQAAEQKAALKRTGIWLGAIAVVLVLLYFGYQRFLAPSPQIQASITYETLIENSLNSGDLTGALDEANQGLAIAPNDPTLLLLKGITQIKLGQTVDGNQTFIQVEELIGNQEQYLLQRTLIYIRVNDYTRALSDAQSVIAANPESAEGYFYEGMAYQNLNQGLNAYTAFDKASTLAEAQGKTALVATIRLDMGLLLQSMDVQGLTPTP